ncbi:MAG TPA: NAD(P)-dependent oxidoreductase [Nocardioidaceae bacterium]|nr:NAD(P)-dependent oxidoreductase [Nocardioidaceae bacterium]
MHVVVAAPPVVATGLSLEGAELFAWDGRGAPPRDDITLWVPAYVVGRDAEDIAATLRQLPRLQVVQLLTAGVEPWPGLIGRGVTLCAGKTIHGGSTAELAVALTLALVRDLPAYVEQQRKREWHRRHPDTLIGRRVLILGAGDIGATTASVFEALGAEVELSARTRHLPLDRAKEQLPATDVLLVALPLTDDTRGLVDASWLSALPDNAIVVNVARGPIVDLEALTAEVAAGRLRAGLDVTDPEPLPADHPLWELPGALITPHAGGGATGWETRARGLIQDQVARLLRGEPLRFVVEDGY